jgi:hypothetical protein
MQRHRHQQVGAGQHLGAGAVHPSPESTGEMRLVAVLQHQHEASAVPIVPQHGTRAIPARLLAGAVGADRVLAHRVRKRQAGAVWNFSLIVDAQRFRSFRWKISWQYHTAASAAANNATVAD